MFSTSADFDNSYSAVKASSSADSYTVQRTGEDLKTIARNLYGDSNLWYVIADANALSPTSELSAGQILTIPQAITSIGNTTATFKPFDPNEALGNLAPTLQDPPARKATGLAQALVMIVTIIVAVIATVLTAGMASPLLKAAVIAVASNVAGQLTAMATGLQSKFDWSAVGEAAVMAVLTAGIGDFSMGKSALAQNVTNGMARQAITATGSELINVSKGKSFSWSNVAKSAVVGGLAAGVVTGIGKAGAGRAVGVNEQGHVLTRTPGQGFSFSHAATTYVTSSLRHAVTERIEAAVYNDDEHQFSWSDVAYRTVHDTLHSSFVNQVAGAPRRQQILFGKDGSGNYVNPLDALRELGSDIMDAGENVLEFFRGQESAAVLPGASNAALGDAIANDLRYRSEAHFNTIAANVGVQSERNLMANMDAATEVGNSNVFSAPESANLTAHATNEQALLKDVPTRLERTLPVSPNIHKPAEQDVSPQASTATTTSGGIESNLGSMYSDWATYDPLNINTMLAEGQVVLDRVDSTVAT